MGSAEQWLYEKHAATTTAPSFHQQASVFGPDQGKDYCAAAFYRQLPGFDTKVYDTCKMSSRDATATARPTDAASGMPHGVILSLGMLVLSVAVSAFGAPHNAKRGGTEKCYVFVCSAENA